MPCAYDTACQNTYNAMMNNSIVFFPPRCKRFKKGQWNNIQCTSGNIWKRGSRRELCNNSPFTCRRLSSPMPMNRGKAGSKRKTCRKVRRLNLQAGVQVQVEHATTGLYILWYPDISNQTVLIYVRSLDRELLNYPAKRRDISEVHKHRISAQNTLMRPRALKGSYSPDIW